LRTPRRRRGWGGSVSAFPLLRGRQNGKIFFSLIEKNFGGARLKKCGENFSVLPVAVAKRRRAETLGGIQSAKSSGFCSKKVRISSKQYRPKVFLPDFQRPVLKKIKKYLEKLDRIIIIKGPRRTGKTTLLYQIVDFLLKSKREPFDILFLSFDDPSLRIDLEKIFETYQEIREKTIDKGEIYCLLDEVHFLDNWQFVVKKYFDKKYPIKFLVSSSSASLFKKGTESLAGRTVEEVILPFSFKEVVLYNLRQDENFLEFFKKRQLSPYENEIKILFKNYLIKGGFPHLLSVKESFLAYLIFRFKNFSFSSGKKIRSSSKVYLSDSGLINLFGNASSDFILESIVARELLQREGIKTYYFRDKYEVDFVLEEQKRLIPIEVKNKTKLNNQDFKGLLCFMKEFKVKKYF